MCRGVLFLLLSFMPLTKLVLGSLCLSNSSEVLDGGPCQCDPGFFMVGSGGVCALCPIGSYCVGGGVAAVECPLNSGSTVHGAVSVALCKCIPGYVSFTPGGRCYQCLPGGYCPGYGETMLPCPKGTFQTGYGMLDSVGCTLCGPGTYSLVSASTAPSDCQVCAAGSYQSGLGASARSECMQCGRGTYSSVLGVSMCSFCQAGTVQTGFGVTDASKCLLCMAGTYQTGVGLQTLSDCNQCPKGTYQTGLGTPLVSGCLLCRPGTYQPNVGQPFVQSCFACPEGTFQPDEGATTSIQCVACAAGSYQSSASGEGFCTLCDAGTFSVSVRAIHSRSCTPCSAGSYQPVTGANMSGACIKCSVGTYQTGVGIGWGGGCLSCTPGTYQVKLGASLADDCVACPVGTYSALMGATALADCASCGPGTFQTGVGVDSQFMCSLCQAGTYQTGSAASSVSQCTPCPAGRYFAGSGGTRVEVCVKCSAGTFQTVVGAVSGAECVLCGPGTYQSGRGAGSPQDCISCSPGTYQTLYGLGSVLGCLSCGRGTFSSGFGMGGSLDQVCGACETGTYQSSDSLGGSSCVKCDAGKFQTATRASSCSLCGPGTYQPLFGVKYDLWCTKCEQGTYSTGVGMPSLDSCSPCGAGRFSEGVGLTGCGVCGIGKYTPESRGGVCFSCMSGTYSNKTGASACTKCPVGTCLESTGGVVCDLCRPGNFQFLEGGSACFACQPGSYQGGAGATACVACPSGKFQTVDNATMCDDCAAGGYAAGIGLTVCASCPVGSYQSIVGSSGCVPCPAGAFWNRTGALFCLPCAEGSYRESTGSSSCVACEGGRFQPSQGSTVCVKCAEGTYHTAMGLLRQADCRLCPAGRYAGVVGSVLCQDCSAGTMSSAEGFSACSQCVPGTFQTGGGGTSCVACRSGTFASLSGASAAAVCAECPAGSFSSTPSSTACSLCLAGSHSSIRGVTGCSLCGAGTYADVQGWNRATCPPCPPGTYSVALGAFSSDTCVRCDDGYFSSLEGRGSSASCVICPLGSVSVDNKTSCSACVQGTFCPSGGSVPIQCVPGLACNGTHMDSPLGMLSFLRDNCTGVIPCPRGTQCALGDPVLGKGLFARSPNQTHFVVYEGGSNASALSCPGLFIAYTSVRVNWPVSVPLYTPGILFWLQPEGCPVGMYLLGDTCTACPIGMFSGRGGALDWSACQVCPAGTAGLVAGSASCVACAAGSFAALSQSTACQLCASGSYQPQGGGTSCIECGGGSFSANRGMIACVPCPAGTFQSNVGGTGCLDCNSDEFSSSGDQDCSLCGVHVAGLDRANSCPMPLLPGNFSNSLWLSMRGVDSDDCLSTGMAPLDISRPNTLALSYVLLRQPTVCVTSLYVTARPGLSTSWSTPVGGLERAVSLRVIAYNATFYPELCKINGFGVMFTLNDAQGRMLTDLADARAVMSILDPSGQNLLYSVGCSRLPRDANADVPVGVCRTTFCPTMRVVVRVALSWGDVLAPALQGQVDLSPGPVGFCPPTSSWLASVELQSGSVPYFPGDILTLLVSTVNPPLGRLVVFRFALRILSGVTMMSFQSTYSIVTEYVGGVLSVVGDSSQGGGAVLGELKLRLDAAASGVVLVAEVIPMSFQFTLANAVPYSMLVRSLGFSCRSDGYIDVLTDFRRSTGLIINRGRASVVNWRRIQASALEFPLAVRVVAVWNVMHAYTSVVATCTSLSPASLEVASCALIRGGRVGSASATLRVQYQTQVAFVNVTVWVPSNTTLASLASVGGGSGRYRITTTLSSGTGLLLRSVDATPYIPSLVGLGVTLYQEQWKCTRKGTSFAMGVPVMFTGSCGSSSVSGVPSSLFLVMSGTAGLGRYTFNPSQVTAIAPAGGLLVFSSDGRLLPISSIDVVSEGGQLTATKQNASEPGVSLSNSGGAGRCVSLRISLGVGASFTGSVPVIPAGPVSMQIILSTYTLVSQSDVTMFIPTSAFVIRAILIFSDGYQLGIQSDPRLTLTSDLLDVWGLGVMSRETPANATLSFHFSGIPCVTTTVLVRVLASSVESSQIVCPSCPAFLTTAEDPLALQFPSQFPSSISLSAVMVRRVLVDGRVIDRVEPVSIAGDALVASNGRLLGVRGGEVVLTVPSVPGSVRISVLGRWGVAVLLICNGMACSRDLLLAPPGDGASLSPFNYSSSLTLSLQVTLVDGRTLFYPWLRDVGIVVNGTLMAAGLVSVSVPLVFGVLSLDCVFGTAWGLPAELGPTATLLMVHRLSFLSLQGSLLFYQLHCSGLWEEARFTTEATLTNGVVMQVVPRYGSSGVAVVHHAEGLVHAEGVGQGWISAYFGGLEAVVSVFATVSSRYFVAVDLGFLPAQWTAPAGQILELSPVLSPLFVTLKWFPPALLASRVVRWHSSAPDVLGVSADSTAITILGDYYQPVTVTATLLACMGYSGGYAVSKEVIVNISPVQSGDLDYGANVGLALPLVGVGDVLQIPVFVFAGTPLQAFMVEVDIPGFAVEGAWCATGVIPNSQCALVGQSGDKASVFRTVGAFSQSQLTGRLLVATVSVRVLLNSLVGIHVRLLQAVVGGVLVPPLNQSIVVRLGDELMAPSGGRVWWASGEERVAGSVYSPLQIFGDTDGDGAFTSMDVLFMEKYIVSSVFRGEQMICVILGRCQSSLRLTVWQLMQLKPVRAPTRPATRPDGSDVMFLLRALVGKAFFLESLIVDSKPGHLSVSVGLRDYSQQVNPSNAVVRIQFVTASNRELSFNSPFEFNAATHSIMVLCRGGGGVAYTATSLPSSTTVDETMVGLKIHTQSLDSLSSDVSALAEDRAFTFLPGGPVTSISIMASTSLLAYVSAVEYLPTVNCQTLCDDASLFLDNSGGAPVWTSDQSLVVSFSKFPPVFRSVWPLLSTQWPATFVSSVAVVSSVGGPPGVLIDTIFNMTVGLPSGCEFGLYRVTSSPPLPLLAVYGGDFVNHTGLVFMGSGQGGGALLEFRMVSEGVHTITLALLQSFPSQTQTLVQTFVGIHLEIASLELAPQCVAGVILWSRLVAGSLDEPCVVVVTPVWVNTGRGLSESFTCTVYPCILQGFGQVIRPFIQTMVPSVPRIMVQRPVLSLGHRTQWRVECALDGVAVTVTERVLSAGLIRASPANSLVITGDSIRSTREGWATVSLGGVVKTGINVSSAVNPPRTLRGFVFSSITLALGADSTASATFDVGPLHAGSRGYVLVHAVYSGGYSLLLDPRPGTDGISVRSASADVVVSQLDGSFLLDTGAAGSDNQPIVSVEYQGVYTLLHAKVVAMAPVGMTWCCNQSLASMGSSLYGMPSLPSQFVLPSPVVYFAGRSVGVQVRLSDPRINVVYDPLILKYDGWVWTLMPGAPSQGVFGLVVQYTHPVSLQVAQAAVSVNLIDVEGFDVRPESTLIHRIHCSASVFERVCVGGVLRLTGGGVLDVSNDIMLRSSDPAVVNVSSEDSGPCFRGKGVGSVEITAEMRGLVEVFVVRVVDTSVTFKSILSPGSYDLRGVVGSVFHLAVSGVLNTGELVEDISFLDFNVTLLAPTHALASSHGLAVKILGNSRGVYSTVRVDLSACESAGALTTASSLEAHIIADAVQPLLVADAEVQFHEDGGGFTVTLFSTVPVLAFFIQILTDAVSLGRCTPLAAMPQLGDCSENTPVVGTVVMAGAKIEPFPPGRAEIATVVAPTVTVVWGYVEIFTGASVMRFSIQAGVYGSRDHGVNSSVDRIMHGLPIVDTSVLYRSLSAIYSSPSGTTLRSALFNLLLLVGRQRSVDARIYSNEFELSVMIRVTDRFLAADPNQTSIMVLLRTDLLPSVPGGSLVQGEGLWVPAQHVFDGWYTVEFRQKIPVMRLSVGFAVSTLSSRYPWMWEVDGLIDTGRVLPSCPRTASQTATFLSSYHISLDVLHGMPLLTQGFVDRLACGMQVASRRVMVSPVSAGGGFSITVALESLNRVHQANFLLMGDFLSDELGRLIQGSGGNGSLVGIERGGLQYINDTSDPPVPCPDGFYFDKNGTYRPLPPHAVAGVDCYDMMCSESYTLMEETQHCIPTPAAMDVLWICVMVVLTVIISLGGLVCCVQMALWKTEIISDVVFDPVEAVPPVIEAEPCVQDDEHLSFGDPDECALYYDTVMADVILDDYSAMMVEGMFSPVDLGAPSLQTRARYT